MAAVKLSVTVEEPRAPISIVIPTYNRSSWLHGTLRSVIDIRPFTSSPGLGATFAYFRTWWGNFTVLQNTAVTPSDFT